MPLLIVFSWPYTRCKWKVFSSGCEDVEPGLIKPKFLNIFETLMKKIMFIICHKSYYRFLEANKLLDKMKTTYCCLLLHVDMLHKCSVNT